MQRILGSLNPWQPRMLVLAVTVFAIGLTRCTTPTLLPTQPAERAPMETVGVPFRTVAQAAPLGNRPPDPACAVIVKPDTPAGLETTFPPDALEAAETVARDDGTIAVLAFAGTKATSGHQITIENIQREGKQLIVTVIERDPEEDANVEPAMTLPYHVISLTRASMPDGITHVVFRDESGLLHREVYAP